MTTASTTRSQSDSAATSVSKKTLWAGRVISALPILLLTFSAVMKFATPSLPVEMQVEMSKQMAALGWPMDLLLALGIVELACVVIYAIPRTAVLGAILITAYLGGATATHVRIGDPYFIPIIVGVLVWLGLLLREPRLRAILPLRANP
ncbi:MAG: DoxX family protein [Planctomycetaceae bacterium]